MTTPQNVADADDAIQRSTAQLLQMAQHYVGLPDNLLWVLKTCAQCTAFDKAATAVIRFKRVQQTLAECGHVCVEYLWKPLSSI